MPDLPIPANGSDLRPLRETNELLPGPKRVRTVSTLSSVIEDTGHSSLPFLEPGGVASSVYLLAAMSLGVGVFALPDVLKSTGILLGGILLLIFAVLSDFTQCLLIRSTRIVGDITSYDQLAEEAWGKYGALYLSISMTITPFIANCAHFQAMSIVLGYIIVWFASDKPDYHDNWPLQSYKKAIIVVLLLAIAAPFCLERRVSGSLRFIGTLSVMTVIILATSFVLYAICMAPGNLPQGDEKSPLFHITLAGIFQASGTICFSYSGLTNLFPVYHEIKDRGQIYKAIHWGTGLCFVTYLTVAAVGAVVFGKALEGNCLYNIKSEHQNYFRPVMFCLVVFITLLYPVLNFPLVTSVESIIYGPGRFSKYSRALISLGSMIGVIIVDLVVPNPVDLFGLCGSLGLGSVVYIIPCLIFFKVDRTPIFSPIKLFTLLVLIIGLAVTLVSTGFVIQSIAQNK